MLKKRKTYLSPLDKKCLMKFYLHELKLFQESSNEYVKSLGVEGGYETILALAEEDLVIKVNAVDENNFVILFDENCNNRYSPLFIMRNGYEEIFEGEITD